MIKSKDPASKVLSFALIILMLTTANLLSRLPGNGAGKGYCDPGVEPDCDPDKGNSTIETYIEIGGGYFLNAFSDILSMSNRVEMSSLNGLDYNELQTIVNNGLDNIRNAKSTYLSLIQAAEETPYSQAVISKLKNFAYSDFMIKHSLNSILFKEVEGYLENGDITGTFKRFYNSCVKIEKLMTAVNGEVSLNRMPKLDDLWKINEEASTTLLFGQGISRIFDALK